jgi:DNA-directed RNA polymerase subunit RPC12/RpoP
MEVECPDCEQLRQALRRTTAWLEKLQELHGDEFIDDCAPAGCRLDEIQTLMPKSYECTNCGRVDGPLKRVFPDIPDLLERIAPGEPVPEGECPHCGFLVHAWEEK